MAKKADAWKEYQEAAMVDMMLEVMPKVAAEIAAPLTKTNKITMVADSNGEIGASKLTAEASTPCTFYLHNSCCCRYYTIINPSSSSQD